MPQSTHRLSHFPLITARGLLTWMLACAFFALTGCDSNPVIKLTWDKPKAEVREGMLVRLDGAEVGKITKISAENGFYAAKVEIYRDVAPRIRSESAFVVRRPAETAPYFIDIVTVHAASEPIVNGAVYRISDNEMDVAYKVAKRHWPTILTAIGILVVVLLLILVCFRQISQIAAVVFCLAVGIAGAWFGAPYAQPYIAQWVSDEFRPDWIAYAVCFFVAHLVALMFVKLVRSPAKKSKK